MPEDAKLRQALKSELCDFIRDSAQELSSRIRRNLESSFLLDRQRLEELAQNGLLDAIVDQSRMDMLGLIDEFLGRATNAQSRTMTPLDDLPTAMEDSCAAPALDMTGTQLDLPVDGF